MSVAGYAVLGEILPRHWQAQAKKCGLPGDMWIAFLRNMIVQAPDLASDTLRRCRDEGLITEVLDYLRNGVAARCGKLAACTESSKMSY